MNEDFIGLIEVCFNPILHTTLYTKFTVVSGEVKGCQTGGSTSNFKKDYFKDIIRLIVAVYKKEPLDRGHLAAFADFTYYSQRMATQYYINTVPQWSSFNRGNWKTLEGRIRKMAREANTNLIVYAGSCNVPKKVNNDKYTYRATQVVPVPEHLFRILYNQITKQSLVFLGINNVHRDMDISQHIACEENYDELKSFTKRESFFEGFNRKDITKGYIYCCRLTDFLDSCNLNNSPLSKFLLQ
jgi:DNA/RNA endonuclease G (NUC1)